MAFTTCCVFFFLSAAAFGEDVAVAAMSEDCDGEYSLVLHQLRGMKVSSFEASLGVSDDPDGEDDGDVSETLELGLFRGSCRNPADMTVWRGGGKKSFNAALNHCGRSCKFVGPWYAGFPCTKDCMQKRGYSDHCASCMAELVGCKRDHCLNPCFSDDENPSCIDCVKSNCRHKMRVCSGLNTGNRGALLRVAQACRSRVCKKSTGSRAWAGTCNRSLDLKPLAAKSQAELRSSEPEFVPA